MACEELIANPRRARNSAPQAPAIVGTPTRPTTKPHELEPAPGALAPMNPNLPTAPYARRYLD